MNDNLITAQITGVAGNTATSTLEVSTDFHPIVRVAISSANPESTTRNLIFKVFQDSDEFVERCKPFVEKMESDCLKDEENYLIPYLRMWPPQEGERIFTLACMIGSGKDNCANQGDIYVEMPVEVSGLKIVNIPDGVIKDVYTYSTVPLELSLTTDADRTLTDIKAVPLIFYVMNNGERIDVGKIHLSVAPRDVFSEAEVEEPIRYLQGKPFYTHKIMVNGVLKGHDCITAVRVCAEKLLGVNLKGAVKKESFTIWDWEEYLQKKGYLKERININLSHDKKTGEVYNSASNEEKASFKFDNSIENSMGYHIYSVGYHIHTETFVIYNNLHSSVQTMYWQRGIRLDDGWKDRSLKDIDESIRIHIKSWSDFCRKNYGYYKSYSFFLKLQRALFILLTISILGLFSPLESYAYSELYTAEIKQKQNKQTSCSGITFERYDQILSIIESSGFRVCKSFARTVQTAKDDELEQMIYFNIKFTNTIFFDLDYDTMKPLYCFVFYQFDNNDEAITFASKIYEVEKDILAFPTKLSENLYFRLCVKKNVVLLYQTWDSVEEEEVKIKKLLSKCDEMDWDKVYQ